MKLWNNPIRELHTIVGLASKEQLLAKCKDWKGKPYPWTKQVLIISFQAGEDTHVSPERLRLGNHA